MKEIVENFESKVTELEAKDVEMRDKIAQQDSLLSDLLREFAPMKSNQSAVASINGLPSSCSDLKMIGHTLNGIYSIAGSSMIESVYCDFTKRPSDAGKCLYLIYLINDLTIFSKRFPEMDRIQRRQIGTRPFLRPAQFFVDHIYHSNSVRFGACERGKRHGFDVWDIYGPAAGNLFFLVHGSGAISNFIISCFYRSWPLFERGSHRIELD
jgi:hypothetical protein